MQYKLSTIVLPNYKAITLYFKNKKAGITRNLTFSDTHPNFKAAFEWLQDIQNTTLFLEELRVERKDAEVLFNLHDIFSSISSWSNGDLKITRTEASYNGTPLSEELTDFLIKQFLKNPQDEKAFEAWSKFIRAAANSTTDHVVDRLFLFLSKNDLYLSPCGEYVYAWRVCTSDYKDKYTRTFDNSVGSECRVPRNQVESDPNKACSKGLHVASIDYLASCYASTNDRLLVVKVPIADIVSIPYDYEGSKVRVSSFLVVEDVGAWGVDVTYDNYPNLSKFGFTSNVV